MVNEVIDIELPVLFSQKPPDQDQNVTRITGASRQYYKHENIDMYLDKLSESIYCIFLRADPKDDVKSYRFSIQGKFEIQSISSGGWLVYDKNSDTSPRYWIPVFPKIRRLDGDAHITEESNAELSGLDISSEHLSIIISGKYLQNLDLIVFEFKPESHKYLDELLAIKNIESMPIFLWGSHTQYTGPANVYRYLIHGYVYDTRFAWPKNWKICSENDAHALYVSLCGLQRCTGKEIYDLLKKQIVLSVLVRQCDDGSWHHGEWTDHMERHFRLHCSAMHLLMDALDEHDDNKIKEALKKAADFISRQHDNLDRGAWFLHDELEKSEKGMDEAPFRYLKSNAFGKSSSNMLVLNTQLDTFVALTRYSRLTGDKQYDELLKSAVAATGFVLSAHPADWLYRPVFKAIELTFLPTDIASRLPVHMRIIKRLAWKYLIPLVPRIKQRYPRLVFPGGYVDRELSLNIFAHEYLSINLMDLLRYYRLTLDESVLSIAIHTIHFGQRTKIWERWQELQGKEYASGFWTEALYHLCLLKPENRHHLWLYKSALFLDQHGHGFPPSLLGANCEAIPISEQIPTPDIGEKCIRTINLSVGGHREFLFINVTSKTIDISSEHLKAMSDLTWSSHPFESAFDGIPVEIPAFSCFRATSRPSLYFH